MPFYVINDAFVVDNGGNIGIGTAFPRGALDVTATGVGLVVPIESESESGTVGGSGGGSGGGGGGGGSIPENAPAIRMSRALGRFERRVQNAWKSSVIWSPAVLSATPTKLQNIGMQTVVTGSYIEPSAVWSFIGANGQEYPCVSQWTNAQTVTLTRPVVFPVSNEPYRLKVYNMDSKTQFITSTLFFDAGDGPSFVTAAGNLSNLTPSTYYNPGIVIEAADEVGGGISNITINSDLAGSGLVSVFSGSNLLIQGTTTAVTNPTTYNFTATAIDLGGNTATRAYSFTIQSAITDLLQNGTFASTAYWTPSQAWSTSTGPWIQDNILFFGYVQTNVKQTIEIAVRQGIELDFSFEVRAETRNGSVDDTYRAYVDVYNTANTVVQTFGQTATTTITTTGTSTWTPVSFSSTVAASYNISKIVVTIEGRDVGNWAGAWYGPTFRNVRLRTSSAGVSYQSAFPPAALTNGVYSTTISGAAYGNGTYVISQSANGWADYKVWKLFNFTYGGFGDFWHTNDTFTATGNYYAGSENIVSGYNGEWVKIQMPVSIYLSKYRIWPRTDVSTSDPRDWRLYGSSNGSTWTLLDTQTNVSGWTRTVSESNYKEFTVSVSASCSYFALVVNRSYNSSMQMSELRFYGA